ncbi:MAG: cellulase family glycosylhydrolase [Ruminococcus sp.]|nr:cellulase family glycosylhydrolase [Ruminococcus sp.]
MKTRLIALLSALMLTVTFAGCKGSKKKEISESSKSIFDGLEISDSSDTDNDSEPQHISPVETVTASYGAQIAPKVNVSREHGSNTYDMQLSDFIEQGDIINSFTFVIYSDSRNIGTFKGGCGISVSDDCPSAVSEKWYQSPDFTSGTEGAYGEITWNVPAEIQKYILADGKITFGYWWGNVSNIRLDTVVCNFTRTRELPVDGTVDISVNKSVSYSAEDRTAAFSLAGSTPSGTVPQAVTFNISTDGAFDKFTGAFGVKSSLGEYLSSDVAVFTGNSSLSLTWILPDEARAYAAADDAQVYLGYWWSERPTLTLSNAVVKYSIGDNNTFVPSENKKPTENIGSTDNSADFRTAQQIVNEIKVGWNLGNTLECYDYSSWTNDAETAWGNPVTTKGMINSVKTAGFNAIRIPVTWNDHMTGDKIDSAWLDRVQEVVDYAYNDGMFVIINMHHDDYTWFKPNDAEYAANSARLCSIWSQVSERFKNYGDRLLFEGMNEPRTVGSSAEWNGGTAPERSVINKYEQDFVNTVRASGGNNAERTLIVTSYAASAVDAAINDVVIPSDKNIAISIHYYAPWNFADGQTTSFTENDKIELSNKFSQLKSMFADKGTPVIIGEFGCVKAASDTLRGDYFEYYISEAKKFGIKCFVWDNGTLSGESSFGIFDRDAYKWTETILKGIIDGAE